MITSIRFLNPDSVNFINNTYAFFMNLIDKEVDGTAQIEEYLMLKHFNMSSSMFINLFEDDYEKQLKTANTFLKVIMVKLGPDTEIPIYDFFNEKDETFHNDFEDRFDVITLDFLLENGLIDYDSDGQPRATDAFYDELFELIEFYERFNLISEED